MQIYVQVPAAGSSEEDSRPAHTDLFPGRRHRILHVCTVGMPSTMLDAALKDHSAVRLTPSPLWKSGVCFRCRAHTSLCIVRQQQQERCWRSWHRASGAPLHASDVTRFPFSRCVVRSAPPSRSPRSLRMPRLPYAELRAVGADQANRTPHARAALAGSHCPVEIRWCPAHSERSRDRSGR
jgi:hypothetical protein